MSSTKDFSNINKLAMGNTSNVDLAQMCLHQTAFSATLASVLRAAHDRIMHLDQQVTTLQNTIVALPKAIAEELTAFAETSIATDPETIVTAVTEETLENTDRAVLQVAIDEAVQSDDNPASEDEEEILHVVIVTQPELSREAILRTALAHGFKKRPQPEGREDDLNEYVYEFAQDIRNLSRLEHHVVNISELPRYTVYEDNGQVIIRAEVDGKYVAFDALNEMVEQGRIHVETSDDGQPQPE